MKMIMKHRIYAIKGYTNWTDILGEWNDRLDGLDIDEFKVV